MLNRLIIHAVIYSVCSMSCRALNPWYIHQLTQIQHCHLVWNCKSWTQSLWRTNRTHKIPAKCYNTGRSNLTSGFSITFFDLESSQMSFTQNGCRDELKTSVTCWICGYTDGKKGFWKFSGLRFTQRKWHLNKSR